MALCVKRTTFACPRSSKSCYCCCTFFFCNWEKYDSKFALKNFALFWSTFRGTKMQCEKDLGKGQKLSISVRGKYVWFWGDIIRSVLGIRDRISTCNILKSVVCVLTQHFLFLFASQLVDPLLLRPLIQRLPVLVEVVWRSGVDHRMIGEQSTNVFS